VIGEDRVLPPTTAPGSIQEELRAYNSMEPSRRQSISFLGFYQL
jgi:hypothetical protein